DIDVFEVAGEVVAIDSGDRVGRKLAQHRGQIRWAVRGEGGLPLLDELQVVARPEDRAGDEFGRVRSPQRFGAEVSFVPERYDPPFAERRGSHQRGGKLV